MAFITTAACHAPVRSVPAPASAAGEHLVEQQAVEQQAPMLGDSRQMIVVKTADWNTTKGTLQRYERATTRGAWHATGAEVPIIVGRTGLAWGVGFDQLSANEPVKHEGDGKSPAGVFPLDTAFGFAPASDMSRLKLPYYQLRDASDCVDDTASAHYNTVVERDRVPAVDWNSSEHMRTVGQYRIGVIVGYNAAPPVRPRGSCIFLHIWNGPESYTAGCTAMDADVLHDVMLWLDPRAKPMLVQLTTSAYGRLRGDWKLP